MLKKLAVGLCLAIVIIVPFIMKAQNTPPDQMQQVLKALSHEQLIQIIMCMNQRNTTLDRCISSVLPKPTMKVLTPNGGEILINGATTTIKWQSNSSSSPVQIYLDTQGSRSQTLIASNVPNTGSYTWTPSISEKMSTSTGYKIGIKVGGVNQSAYDTSDSMFWIINKPVNPPMVENTAQLCSDGIDNDGDLMIDLSDTDCAQFVLPPATTTPNAVVTVLNPATQIPSKNYQNNSSPVALLDVQLKAEVASTVITSLTASNIFATTAVPMVLQIFDGSTLLASASSTTGIFTFNNMNYRIAKDSSRIFTIKGLYNSNQSGFTRYGVTAIRYQKNSTTVEQLSTNVVGSLHFIGPKIAEIRSVSPATMTVLYSTSTPTSTSFYTAKFKGSIIPKGGNMSSIQSGDVSVILQSTDGNRIHSFTPNNIVVTLTPNINPLPEGTSAMFDVTANISSLDIPQSGLYAAVINYIRWNVGGTNVSQTWGLGDFKTNLISVVK
jgi:hypothetical protein